jgi:hypothetical protein
LLKYFLYSLFIYFILLSNTAASQHLSKFEKRWAIWHPIAALKIKHIGKACYKIYNSHQLKNELDSFENGGKLDAFRHLFFMAAFAQKVNAKKIKKLGIAHEKTNYQQFLNNTLEHNELPDSLSTVMDLYNNNIGINLGKQNKKLDYTQLKTLIINQINAGTALIIKRNLKAQYVRCNNQLLPIIKAWQQAKCLVNSNYIPNN